MATTPNLLNQDQPLPIKTNFWWRFVKYLLVGIIANGSLWTIALSYLKNTPLTYTSEAVINVAGNGPGVSVNLPEIGQAYTSGGSGFNSASSDPRENYKLIASSKTVIDLAAESLNLTPEEFEEPRLKIINNTTLLSMEIKGENPEIAQQKLAALYQVLNQRLDKLRERERIEREQSSRNALLDAQKKLTDAQLKLSKYKAKSGLHSSEQIKQLINNIESLRQQRAKAFAQQQEIRTSLEQLSLNLKISPQEAADALELQTDRQFQQSLTEYSTATTKLEELLSYRGPNYPDVVKIREKQQAILALLLERGEILLGKPVELLTLEKLSLDNSNGSGEKRAELFQKLVNLDSDYQGSKAQVTTLNQQIQVLEIKLRNLSKKETILASLIRELQIAEAVFASTLARVDLGRGDAFGSFPLIQIIEEPSLPEKPTAPKPKLVLAGTILGSLLVSTSLTLLWWRNPLARVTKKVIVKILA